MLSQNVLVDRLHADQWRRLTELAYADRKSRKVYLIHEGGKPSRVWDSVAGDLPVPTEVVKDAQAVADALLKGNPEAKRAVVVDPAEFLKAMAGAQNAASLEIELDDYALLDWQARDQAAGCAVAPRTGFLWHGLPIERLKTFVARMLPPRVAFVLGVFDGDALWCSAIVLFENGKITRITTTDALPADDVKDIVGRDQHPFFLSAVSNTLGAPAYGWFCERADFEAWMRAQDEEAKDEVFQRALMEKRATFDFSILIDRGMTSLSPINPGELAVVGQDREANPRTRTPDPDEPGPSAL